MSTCPNKQSIEYRSLVNEVGEFEAFRQYIANGNEFPTSVIENVSKVNKWFKENLPNYQPQWQEEVIKVAGNMEGAWGAFKNSIIRVVAGAPKGTAYHEAFHAVFRDLLTEQEKKDIYTEAQQKYGMPTPEDLDKLNQEYGSKFTNNDEPLMWLWYEEKLADDFAEYTDTFQDTKASKSLIERLFDRLLKWFGFFNDTTDTQINSLERLFQDINKGKFKKKTKVSKVMDAIDSIEEQRNKVIEGFSPSEKKQRVEALANKFIVKYFNKVNSGTNPKEIKASDIYKEILNEYNTLMKDMLANPANYSRVQAQTLIKFRNKFNEFITEANRYIASKGINVKETVEFKEQDFAIEEDETNPDTDVEVTSMNGQTTKGLTEMVYIPGMKSASTRLKLFLSSIPVMENGKVKTDVLGDTVYYDFHKLYYYLERNLTGLYSFEDQLEKLNELAEFIPEVNTVIERLTEENPNQTTEEFQRLKNDFKTNFSKQQLGYTLVLYDTDSSTGTVSYKILDANRQTLPREIINEWESNLLRADKNTIATIMPDGTVVYFGKDKAKAAKEEWDNAVEGTKALKYDQINRLLLSIGIEFSKDTLENLVKTKDAEFVNAATKVFDWYADENYEQKQGEAKKALSVLVGLELNARLERFSSSFNNVEKKSIYTIQLPSYASKLLAGLTNKNQSKGLATIAEFEKDSTYKYSNILESLKKDETFRKNHFNISYLDGLKDEKGHSLGAKFTKMSPKDFMAMSIALFQNTSINKQKVTSRKIGKYMYIIPSDKTMSMIIDSVIYGVGISNGQVLKTSEIVGKFYNVVLQEAERIRKALIDKQKVENGLLSEKDLLAHYHYKKGSDPKAFDGQAYKFLYFNALNQDELGTSIMNAIKDNLDKPVEVTLKALQDSIKNVVVEELNNELEAVIQEALDKDVIARDSEGRLINRAIDKESSIFSEGVTEDKIIQSLGEFALNQWLTNIEVSRLFNGDPAQYKPKDLAKRTYQSGSMTVMGNGTGQKIKTITVKDVEIETPTNIYEEWVKTLTDKGYSKAKAEKILETYKKGNNVADAQTYIHPNLYKRIMQNRGTWTPDYQEAFDVAEGVIENPTKEQLENSYLKLSGLKPFYFGSRFDEKLGVQRYEQVKTAMFPLFKSLISDNPLLQKQRELMDNTDVELIGHESAFKAAMGNRFNVESLTEGDINSHAFDLEMDNFGIQVDNPEHLSDDENSSIRQVKMLLIGATDPSKEYNGKKGSDILKEIDSLEAANVDESLDDLLVGEMASTRFKEYLKEQLTKRNSTENIEKALEVDEQGNFKFPMNFGPYSTAVENMISSVFTSRVIKQEFFGGSAVQVTGLGFQLKSQFKNLKEQQEFLEKEGKTELLNLQSTLRHVRIEDGKVEYAEAIMPAWTKKFFNADGTLKDADSIPKELRELFVYRIPTEGYHSMLPVRVVKFLPVEAGNFMILPYEITTQFGADFDFDKTYFLAPEFESRDGKLNKIRYIAEEGEIASKKRYNQHIDEILRSAEARKLVGKSSPAHLVQKLFGNLTEKGNIKREDKIQILFEEGLLMSFEDFKELPIERQNTKAARNNRILENYLTLLTSIENFDHLITPSGFKELAEEAGKIKSETRKGKERNFFSGVNQRDLKQRNHTGIGLKGQLALHVTGHSFATKLGLFVEEKHRFKFNDEESASLSKMTIDGSRKLIADDVASTLAAILDDIKDPIVATLGINAFTADVYATIVRAGYSIKTAVNLITQPAIRELSDRLESNNYQIKEQGFGRYTIDTLKGMYDERYLKVKQQLPPVMQERLTKDEEYIETYNLNDKDMEKWRKFAQRVNVNDFSKENVSVNPEIADYYNFQRKVLYNYSRYDKVAQGLVKYNRLFAVNKEVGPNIENIADKKYLLQEITEPEFIIKVSGNQIESLNSYIKTQEEALKYFQKYFPYTTDRYEIVKETVAQMQFGKGIHKMNAEKRMKINGFLSHYLDYKLDTFKGIMDRKEKERLMKDLPYTLSQIKKLGNEEYTGIRRNPFIEQLKVTWDKNYNNIKIISLKGNKLDTASKDNVSEAFMALWNNDETHGLAEDLVKYSFLSSGFFTGLNSYHNLIPIEILQEMGFDTHRKKVNSDLNSPRAINWLSSQEVDLVSDLIVRNFSSDFTKVIDESVFDRSENIISSSYAEIKSKRQANSMILSEATDEEGNILAEYAKFIRVYNKTSKRSELFKIRHSNGDMVTYERVGLLGQKGKLIEVYDDANAESIVPKNNYVIIDETSKGEASITNEAEESEDSTDEAQQEVIESTTETQEETTETTVDNPFAEFGYDEGAEVSVDNSAPDKVIDSEDDVNEIKC